MRRPRVLFVGRERHRLPLPPNQRRKWDALGELMDLRVLAVSADGPPTANERFRLVGTSRVGFHLALPFRVAGELRRFRPDAVFVQGVHEAVGCLLARRLARVPARVILDVQGDWRHATRSYGSPLRRLLSPVADLLARVAVARADAIRTVSAQTTELVRLHGREPAATFPSYVDLDAFASRPPAPLPERPQALFVGALEPVKGIDTLAAAWRLAAPAVAEARLRIVGRGSRAAVVEALVADLPAQTTWTPSLPNEEVATALDASWLLVLPSRSEGLPRVAIEAICRGRAVIGARAGGIPDVVEGEVNGVVVDPGRPEELADALVRLLSDRPLAERLGAGAWETASRLTVGPDEYSRTLYGVVQSTHR